MKKWNNDFTTPTTSSTFDDILGGIAEHELKHASNCNGVGNMISYILIVNLFVVFAYYISYFSNDNTYPHITTASIYSSQLVWISNENISKYSNESNRKKMCALLFPNTLHILRHHKMGIMLQRALVATILRFCNGFYKQTPDHCVVSLQNISYLESANLSSYYWKKKSNVSVFLHFLREPMNTILSGYFYHMTLYGEPFNSLNLRRKRITPQVVKFLETSKTLYGEREPFNSTAKFHYSNVNYTLLFLKMANYYITTRANDHQKAFRKNSNHFLFMRDLAMISFVYNPFKNPYFGFVSQGLNTNLQSQINEFNWFDFYTHNFVSKEKYKKHVGLMNFYKNLKNTTNNVEMGLIFEMYIFSAYQFVQCYLYQSQLRNENYYFDFPMEIWLNKFDTNANQLLDALNLVDNVKNQKILQQFDVAINISNEREILLNSLRKHDVKRGISFNINHVTSLKRNSTAIIQSFLTLDYEICRFIKHMTLLLHFNWKYQHFC